MSNFGKKIKKMFFAFQLAKSITSDVFQQGDYSFQIIGSDQVAVFAKTQDLKELKIPKNVVYNEREFAVTEIGERGFELCKGITGNITIPDTIKKIHAYAFYNCTGINGEVHFGASLETIEEYAFHGCSALKGIDFEKSNNLKVIGANAFSSAGMFGATVKLPDSLVTIDSFAFAESKFKYLIFGKNLKTIGNFSFYSCENIISQIEFPTTLKTIGDCAFADCKYMNSSITIPDSVTYLGMCAFAGCLRLRGCVSIGAGVTEIYEKTFSGCMYITSLNLGTSVKNIGDEAFFDCYQLGGKLALPATLETIGKSAFTATRFNGSLKLPEKLVSIGESAFFFVQFDGELTFPSSLKTIGECAFSGTKFTGKLEFPNTITVIPERAFECSEITEVVISSSVKEIGANAFSKCMQLKKVVIGKSVVNISLTAFATTKNLAAFEVEAGSTTFVAKDGVLLTAENEVAFFPLAKNFTIPEIAVSIGENVYANRKEKIALTIPGSVKTIKSCAFRSSSFTSVDLGKVEVIESNAFSLSSLSGVLTIPATVKSIGDQAFSSCDITSVNLKDSKATLGANPFYGCDNLENFVVSGSVFVFEEDALMTKDYEIITPIKLNGTFKLPSKATAIGAYTYAHSKITGDIVIPKTIKSIGDGAFTYCLSANGTLTIEEGVEKIGDYAFQGSRYMYGNLTIPDSCVELGAFAFEGCTGFNGTLTLSNKLQAIKESAFAHDNNFRGTLVLPESLTEIGDYAFIICEKMKGPLVIPSKVTKIGVKAFNKFPYTSLTFKCTQLKEISEDAFSQIATCNETIVLPEGLEVVHKNAFQECSQLTGIKLPSTLKTIEERGFYFCLHIKGPLDLSHVEKLGDEAFLDCRELNGSITFGDKLNEVPAGCFLRTCVGPKISFGTGVKIIGDKAFQFCSKIEAIDFGNVEQIGAFAFESTIGLKGEIKLGDSIKIIEQYAFSKAGKSAVVAFDLNKVENICSFAFSESGIESIVIKQPISVIGENAFSSCKNLKSLQILSGNARVSSGAFSGCSSLEKIDIKKFNYFMTSAFFNCQNVTSVKYSDKTPICQMMSPFSDNVVYIVNSNYEGQLFFGRIKNYHPITPAPTELPYVPTSVPTENPTPVPATETQTPDSQDEYKGDSTVIALLYVGGILVIVFAIAIIYKMFFKNRSPNDEQHLFNQVGVEDDAY